ncbi:MAG: ABC transporter ATP-binding protein [Desulfurococcaceae archaeon]
MITESSADRVIEARNLWFKYPRGDWVLRGVDLEVKRGEHVLVVGETGSGKTTLLRALTGLGVLVYGGEVKGSIRILGRDLSEYTTSELSRIVGVVGQNPYAYFSDLHVGEDLYNYALRIHGDSTRAVRAVRKVVEAFSLHSLLDRYFFELSGGEAKRVVVAKALISDPPVLLVDEPLMWLDEQGVGEVMSVLEVLRRLGKSVFVFEHRIAPILDYFDRVLVIRAGVLREVTGSARRLLVKRRSLLNEERSERVLDSEREVVLGASDLYYYYGSKLVLRGVNVTVRSGDKVLIYGANGSGKTTLLKLLAGYLKPTRGRVERRGDAVYIPQNVILFYTEESLRREVEEICRSRRRGPRCIEEGLKSVKNAGIDPDASPFSLSHGQMVKLAVLLAILSGATTLLLDEPFSGLTYADRLRLVKELIGLDRAVVLASSWLEPATVSGWTTVLKLEDHTLTRVDSINYAYSLEELAEFYTKLVGSASA